MGRWSIKIKKPNTKNQEILKWKSTLTPGMKILASKTSQYHESTILEISRGVQQSNLNIDLPHVQRATDIIEIKVAFRIYEKYGYRKDSIGKYNGFSSQYDQWILLYSPNIQPKLAFEVGQGNIRQRFFQDMELKPTFNVLIYI
eukprot:403377092